MKFSKRHLLKTFSWRIIGTLDTLIFSFLISGDINLSVKLSSFTFFTKMIWYYVHERIWFNSKIRNNSKRHIYKTFTWRIIGTMDTFIIGFLLTGSLSSSIQIGGTETISKMILYFLHEKMWYNINFGIENRVNKRSN